MIKKTSYPRQLVIGDEVWSVKFVRKLDGCYGECDPSNNEIRIRMKQSHDETLKTFIHEVVHALEFSFEFDLEHRHVYALEEAVFQLLRDNFLTLKDD